MKENQETRKFASYVWQQKINLTICRTMRKTWKTCQIYKEEKKTTHKGIKRYATFTVNKRHANLNHSDVLFLNCNAEKNFIFIILSPGKSVGKLISIFNYGEAKLI
jgi:hypothetical protein